VIRLPSDAKLFALRGANGATYYAVLFEPAPGVRIVYTVSDPSQYDTTGMTWQPISEQEFNGTAYIPAGDASELAEYVTGEGNQTYGQFWSKLVDQIFGPNDPARNDPSVLGVLAQWAGRPDMGETELLTLLERTPYWQSLTEQRQQWFSLSPGEQQYQIAEWRHRLADEYFQLTGVRADPNDTTGWLNHWAYQVASGAMGVAAVRGQFQDEALKNPESPYSRTIRTEQETQRQRGVDIENALSGLEQLARRWGVRLTGATLRKWATDIIEKKASEADFTQYVKSQASILYPTKDPEMETAQAAEPFLQTYRRVMEEEVDIFNPRVQQALTSGMTAFDFEQQLMSSPEYLGTKGFMQAAQNVIGTAGQIFGFQ
jgi:hypothetical protein